MLTICPECTLQVSDKAITCPHCGYPLKETLSTNIKPKRSTRRRRLPNGFGQISELKDRNLRKPFRAMITVGKDAYGKPICKLLKPISYFATYNEAYQALMEYNKHPYDIAADITMNDLYKSWSKSYFERVGIGQQNNTDLSWKYCHKIHDAKISDLRMRDIRTCIEQADYTVNNTTHKASPIIKRNIKSLFNKLYDYAIEYELIDRNYARELKISLDDIDNKHHIPFTDNELSILWQSANDNDVIRLILIQCYSGFRPQELVKILKSNVNITDMTIIGGMKTKSGTNRTVPIHSKISQFVLDFYNNSQTSLTEYLFELNRKDLTYDHYRYEFNKIIKTLNLNPEHTPHDCRTTFVTNAKKYKVDEYALKRIVGHNIKDVTEDVYTVRPISWLKDEIEKIK